MKITIKVVYCYYFKHNQDLREIHKVGRILEFMAYNQNALHLTRLY